MTGQQDQCWELRPEVSPTPRVSISHRCKLPGPKPRAHQGVFTTPSMASLPCDPEVPVPRDTAKQLLKAHSTSSLHSSRDKVLTAARTISSTGAKL